MDLIAKLPQVAAMVYRNTYHRRQYITPHPTLDWAANLSWMMGACWEGASGSVVFAWGGCGAVGLVGYVWGGVEWVQGCWVECIARAKQPRAKQPRAKQPRAKQPRAKQPRAKQPRAKQPT